MFSFFNFLLFGKWMWEVEHQKLFQATSINHKTKTFESRDAEAEQAEHGKGAGVSTGDEELPNSMKLPFLHIVYVRQDHIV